MKNPYGGRLVSALLLLFFCLTPLPFRAAAAQSNGLSWRLEGAADAVVAYGDGFLALAQGSVWACHAGEREPGLVLAANAGAAIDDIFAGGAGSVLALTVTSATYDIYRIDVEAAALSPMWSIPKQDAPVGVMRRILWQDGQIIIEYQNDSIRKSDLLFFDTATEKTMSRYGCDVSMLAPCEGRMLLGVRTRHEDGAHLIVFYDMDTGQTTPVCEPGVFPEALCFDPEKRQIVAFVAPNASLFSASGEAGARVYLPVAHEAWMGRQCAVNASQLFALSDGTSLLAASLEARQDTKALQITRYNAEGEETKRFRLSHPEIPVQTVTMGYRLTPAMISQLIRGNDTATDIYMVRTFETGYCELLEKGFCYDLTDQEEIYNRVARMPPALSQALMCGGRLLGVPVEMEFDPWAMLACSYETLDELGIALEEIPTNLLDLLDKAAQWYQDGVLDGVRLFNSDDQAFALTWFALNNYAQYASAECKALDYDTPLFRSLMEKCDRLCALLARQGELSDPYLFASVTPKAMLFDQDGGQSAFFPITPQAGMPPRYPVYVTVAVLNPLSQNKEQALVYLRSLIKELPAETRLYFWPEQAGEEERAQYQEQRQIAAEEIARLQGALDGGELDIAGRNEIQLQLADALSWLEELETRQRWEVSPDAVSAYLSIEDGVFVPSSIVSDVIDEAMGDAVRQYAAGEMSSAALVEAIVRKAGLIRLERGE